MAGTPISFEIEFESCDEVSLPPDNDVPPLVCADECDCCPLPVTTKFFSELVVDRVEVSGR